MKNNRIFIQILFEMFFSRLKNVQICFEQYCRSFGFMQTFIERYTTCLIGNFMYMNNQKYYFINFFFYNQHTPFLINEVLPFYTKMFPLSRIYFIIGILFLLSYRFRIRLIFFKPVIFIRCFFFSKKKYVNILLTRTVSTHGRRVSRVDSL